MLSMAKWAQEFGWGIDHKFRPCSHWIEGFANLWCHLSMEKYRVAKAGMKIVKGRMCT